MRGNRRCSNTGRVASSSEWARNPHNKEARDQAREFVDPKERNGAAQQRSSEAAWTSALGNYR